MHGFVVAVMATIRKCERYMHIAVVLSVLFATGTQEETTSTVPVFRQARDDRYFLSRLTTKPSTTIRTLRADERPEARRTDDNSLEKRCIRCTTYLDPYDYRGGDSGRYDSGRNRYYDRYDDRRAYDDRYDYRAYDRDRYDYRSGYEKPQWERDRWYDRRQDDRYDDYSNRGSYDRGSGYEGYRGVGYDNRGYDYRKYNDYRSRPWDDYRSGGSSYDGSNRRYYPSGGRPEPSGYGGAEYASSWSYGRGDNWRDQGYPSYQYNVRDNHYDNGGGGGGYRGYSYLYDRNPSQNTTSKGVTGGNKGDKGTLITERTTIDSEATNSG